ncbi:MAG: cyclic nucleotide-binding protein [Candidatus Fluviicola riflensis]|nr:MAG: cyclic nucleotide-binding protein [Candidatus Fluviicola riflensis]OGS75861.1 MAG: cyclic nucleotide-binding protein [Candidatus Fluviicola riflensis]OGS83541.1 MAG: cyclic nucleotide-binding protein [Fluviicola sp. RIFCSPHIGHO2_01_FULL_43_53]OGS85680.1 MAG: cyclic nucleotide-binding protein [Fluviicola sp. RIFCSPHIGHO2_12_FULL_43_24]
MLELFQYFNNFHKLSKEAENAIIEISNELKIKKNTIIQDIGQTCKTIYFIKTGFARIYYFKEDIEITESFAFENNILARVESLFHNKPSKKAIQLLEDSELIAINANLLFKLYDKFPEIERLFRLIFESAYVDTVNRIENIQFHTAEERYKMLLNESSNVIKRVPLKLIASYLGITPVSLSRIRAIK